MTDFRARLDRYWENCLADAESCGDAASSVTSEPSEDAPGPSRQRVSLADRVALGRAVMAWAELREKLKPSSPSEDEEPGIVRLERAIANGKGRGRRNP